MLSCIRSNGRTAGLLLSTVVQCTVLYMSSARAQEIPPPDAFDRFETRHDPLPRFARPGMAELLAPFVRNSSDTAPLPTTAFTKPETVQQARSHEETSAGASSSGDDRPATTAAVPDGSERGRPVAARKVGHGRATFYQHAGRTASGERYDPDRLTAAHHSLPLGSRVRVVNEENGKSVTVRINDRTNEETNKKRPYVIDLSRGAARALDIDATGSVDIYKTE